jgi:hypothetical protein
MKNSNYLAPSGMFVTTSISQINHFVLFSVSHFIRACRRPNGRPGPHPGGVGGRVQLPDLDRNDRGRRRTLGSDGGL